MTRPVHVVVVAYGPPAATLDALRPLVGDNMCTVVDNSGSEALARGVRALGANYVVPGGNVGFAAGVNCALRDLLTGPPADVLLLNPDASVSADAVAALGAALHAPGHERVCAVAPRQVHPVTGAPQQVVWPWPTPGRAWAEAVGLRRLVFRPQFLIGAVLLLRWEALCEVGLFDERFFLYAEETDWQRRAAERGWSVQLVDDVVAEHRSGGSSGDSAIRETFFHAGSEIYVRKWHGPLGWQLFRAAHIVGALLRLPFRSGQRRAELLRRISLYVAGPAARLRHVRGEVVA